MVGDTLLTAIVAPDKQSYFDVLERQCAPLLGHLGIERGPEPERSYAEYVSLWETHYAKFPILREDKFVRPRLLAGIVLLGRYEAEEETQSVVRRFNRFHKNNGNGIKIVFGALTPRIATE